MNKKITLFLISLLFISSFVQTVAILELSKDRGKSLSYLENFNSEEVLQANVFKLLNKENEPISVEKVTKTLEEDLRLRYPRDYQERLDRINNRVTKLLEDNGISTQPEPDDYESIGFLRRFACWLMGGVYMDVSLDGFEPVYMCVVVEDIEYPQAANQSGYSNQNQISVSEEKLITLGAFLKLNDLQENKDYKDLIEYKDFTELKYKNLLTEIEKIFEEEGVPKGLFGPGFRRFLCRLFGGNWYDVDLPPWDDQDIGASGGACIWGDPGNPTG